MRGIYTETPTIIGDHSLYVRIPVTFCKNCMKRARYSRLSYRLRRICDSSLVEATLQAYARIRAKAMRVGTPRLGTGTRQALERRHDQGCLRIPRGLLKVCGNPACFSDAYPCKHVCPCACAGRAAGTGTRAKGGKCQAGIAQVINYL
jgi:hypothetical protein